MSAWLRDVRADRRVLAAAIAALALLSALDAALGHEAVLIGFFGTVPLGVAALGRPRTTAIAGALAIMAAVAAGSADGMFAATDHLLRVGVVTIVSAIAVWLAVTRTGLERARFRYRLLSDAGSAMSSALDSDVSLRELASLCVRRLCDWCFVFLVEGDGSIRQLTAAHQNPDRQKLALELLSRYPLNPSRSEGPAKVIRTGRPDLQPVVHEGLLRAISADDENLRLLQALGLRSAMITPLTARGRILGAIAFASAESGRVFGADDLRLAEELSARAAMAVDNARLYVRVSDAERDLRRSHVQLEAILGGVADAVTAQDPSGRIVYANEAAARQSGYESAEQLLAASLEEVMSRIELVGEDGRPFPLEELPARRALRGEQAEPALALLRMATGEERWLLIKATAIRDEDGATVLAISVVEDVTEHREREQSQRFLADASGALASSLDVAETLPRVARLAAGRIADWCSIEAVAGDGTWRTRAFAHRDPEREPLVEEVMRRYAPGGARPYLTGPLDESRGRLVESLTDEQLVAAAQDHEHLALLRQLRPRSAITVPLAVRDRLLGVISLATAADGRRLGADDLMLAEELAGHCALALDNARLYEERSRIARTLQESLLPPLLPDLPGLDVAARFRAAGAGIEVGGDFYDVFDLGDAWAVAIGDVCGKGTGAAAITALARHTVRAAAMREEDPSQILGLLNEALLRQRSDRRFCTVLFGRVAQNGRGVSFEFASGGHPLPLVLSAADGGREVGLPGTLLGIVPDPTLRDDCVALAAGDAVVLYTDGVTDAGAPAHVWTPPELASAVGSTRGLDADEIAERVLRAALDAGPEEPRDDIAIIVLKVPDAAPA